MTMFIMLVGLPGSGKSTYAEKQFPTFKIHSSDAIREELSGDVNNQSINELVFKTLHKRVKDDLTAGKDVIYDATNLNWKRRKEFLKELNKIDCFKSCILVATPIETCLSRNAKRDRKVPKEVIDRMYRNFDIPWYNEGWDSICIEYTEECFKYCYGNWSKYTAEVMDYNQDSKWHSLTLGEHCEKTYQYVLQQISTGISGRIATNEVLAAAALHDCGKPYCQTYKDSKGNDSDFAHYYNHENVGAYDSLFFEKDFFTNSLYVAALIRYHMTLHFFKDWKPKTITKYEKEFTEAKMLKEIGFYETLKLLHEGDKYAH